MSYLQVGVSKLQGKGEKGLVTFTIDMIINLYMLRLTWLSTMVGDLTWVLVCSGKKKQ